jgi:hypothetical protein
MEGRRGGFIGSMAGWTRTEWKSLVVAVAISLAVHGALLAAKRPAREGDARSPVLVVRLVMPPVPAARPPVPVAAPTAAGPGRAPRPIAIRSAKAPPAAAAPSPAPATATPDSPPASVPRHAPAAPLAPPPADIVQAEDAPATPVSTPELGDVARQVVGRRLQTMLWISAEGRVEKAFVKRNELGEDVAQALEQALVGVRFTPARLRGEAVPSVLETRLCFDAAGVLDTSSTECLRPAEDSTEPPANR